MDLSQINLHGTSVVKVVHSDGDLFIVEERVLWWSCEHAAWIWTKVAFSHNLDVCQKTV